jgi:alkylhydroperoxidase/carboxymuconolactone decarboxylase family protein YurZ
MSEQVVQDDPAERGTAMLGEVYGPALGAALASMPSSPFNEETVNNLFANVWSRPHLSVRDRRLLVLGATAMMGRADLVATQVRGARISGDLSDAELDEAVLQLAFYAGWGNAAAVQQGILNVRAEDKP